MKRSKTKIICTIGPGACDEAAISALIANGMNVARLNASHNQLSWHREIIKRIRAIDDRIPILLDLPGRKIRVDNLVEPIDCTQSQEIVLTPHSNHGDGLIPVAYDLFHEAVHVGGIISIGDGTLRLEVREIKGKLVVCVPLDDGQIRSGAGVSIAEPRRRPPIIRERDGQFIDFAVDEDVEFLAFSFAESSEEVAEFRKRVDSTDVQIISKVETRPGVENVDSLLEASDGILLDRGDLAVENKLENIGVLQKIVIQRANMAAKPVIVATEMLRSMVDHPTPTKAEVTDVTNAIADGASAVMLSEETAIGKYPVQAVRTLRDIAIEVEKHDLVYRPIRETFDEVVEKENQPRAMAEAIQTLCNKMPITKIVCITMSGYVAKLISSYRPGPSILAVTQQAMTARQLRLVWGVEVVHVPFAFDPSGTEHIVECLQYLWLDERLSLDDTILVAGVSHPRRGNRVNMIEVHKVEDLVETFSWTKRV